MYPLDGEDLETLLMHADTAMYKAKEQGGSSYQATLAVDERRPHCSA